MNFYNLISVPVIIINFLISMTIIFKNREKPEKSIGWLLIFMLVPFLGLILYFLVGRNWQSKNLKERLSPEMIDFVKTSLEEYVGPHKEMAKMVTMGNGSPMFLYNNVTVYKDGVDKFDALLKDLEVRRDRHQSFRCTDQKVPGRGKGQIHHG